jgi:alkylhydroperoxidase/carboxymuconolactone decarboxylase family protein YurZ
MGDAGFGLGGPGGPGGPGTPGGPGGSGATGPSGAGDTDDLADYEPADVWPFPSERYLHEWAPGVLQAQSAWLSSIDSLRAPDRKTHELIRMVCTVILRQLAGVERHARLAAEVGATWDEIAGSILLTEPAFGILLAIEAFPAARRGYKSGAATFAGEDGDDNNGPNNDNSENPQNAGGSESAGTAG